MTSVRQEDKEREEVQNLRGKYKERLMKRKFQSESRALSG
jgi:hypothetical protein